MRNHFDDFCGSKKCCRELVLRPEDFWRTVLRPSTAPGLRRFRAEAPALIYSILTKMKKETIGNESKMNEIMNNKSYKYVKYQI